MGTKEANSIRVAMLIAAMVVASALTLICAGLVTSIVLWWNARAVVKDTPEIAPDRIVETDAKKERRRATAQELFGQASPAVVKIEVTNDSNEIITTGSGVLLSENWYPTDGDFDPEFGEVLRKEHGSQPACVLTNYHVLRRAVGASVILADGTRSEIVEVLADDEQADLALVTVYLPTLERIGTLDLADESAEVGAKVWAVGSPLGLSNSFSEGIVSAIRTRQAQGTFIQTTAPISPGSSGGPLINENGHIIGLVTSTRLDGQNVNFAVAASTIHGFLTRPIRPREIWNGASITKEEEDAFRDAQFQRIDRKVPKDSRPRAGEALLSLWRASIEPDPKTAMQLLESAQKYLPIEYEYLALYLEGKLRLPLALNEAPRLAGPNPTTEQLYAGVRRSTNFNRALRSLIKAAELNPAFSPTQYRLALAYGLIGEWSKSLAASNNLVSLVPRSAEAYEIRGGKFAELGRLDKAMQDYRIAIDLNPTSPNVYVSLAQAYSDLGERENAIEAYRSAIEHGYFPGICHANIAGQYLLMEKFESALAEIDAARAAGWDDELCDDQERRCRFLMHQRKK